MSANKIVKVTYSFDDCFKVPSNIDLENKKVDHLLELFTKKTYWIYLYQVFLSYNINVIKISRFTF